MSAKTTESPFGKIGAPATRALASIGVTSLEQVTQFTEAHFLSLHGFGPKAMRILKEKMVANKLEFNTGE
ncbi:helix-hairpin-helix domain-containing protein [Mucilaginibacter pedocola]|uniref:DNA-binding protein n=1 Tax=Mucilaginibacter pedocola TaxID=1792845 RepID=A0A1S9PLB2_9SPHI|nr:hypothetical protein [Mucilaginibacter pedocola]OOQ61760.1 hypothetical protein BC343_01430 [Mucilaginibacter pedocola]